jgi:hypothetical protein
MIPKFMLKVLYENEIVSSVSADRKFAVIGATVVGCHLNPLQSLRTSMGDSREIDIRHNAEYSCGHVFSHTRFEY